MALIKCPECGREISDKAVACIHCGFPLEELKKENTLKKENAVSVSDNKYSVKITDYKGSKVKVISILKQYYDLSTDEAKQRVTALPLVLGVDECEIYKLICKELSEAGILFEKYGEIEETSTGKYSIRILDYKGSKVKVISVLKFYFDYSMDDAKKAVLQLPLIIETDKEKNILKNVAQELTDAGIIFEIYDGVERISFDLEVKDKVNEHKTSTEESINEPIYKSCPSCNRKHVFYNDQNEFYCNICNVRLVRVTREDVVQQSGSPSRKIIGEVSTSPKYVPKCPTCQSPDIKKISNFEKAESLFWFGALSRKARKQWHCNNCGSEW